MDFRSLITLVEMSEADARQIFFTNGVNPANLDSIELKSAYRKLMMKHHPDRGGDTGTAQAITSAYDTLKSLEDRPRQATKAAPSAPNEEFSMGHTRFNDIDYVKWYFEQLTAGQPTQNWTVMNFDGHFFRGSMTVKGNADMFTKMGEVMEEWDSHFNSQAIFVGTRSMLEKGTVAVIGVLGKQVKPMVTLQFDSPNLNPANDSQFCQKLPAILDAIADGSFVSQTMMD